MRVEKLMAAASKTFQQEVKLNPALSLPRVRNATCTICSEPGLVIQ